MFSAKNNKPFSSMQIAVIGILMLIIIVAVATSVIMPRCGTVRPLPIVDSSASNQVQKQQAERLKYSAYKNPKEFIRQHLKTQSAIVFAVFDKNMVKWLKKNEFSCIINTDFKNNVGAMMRSIFSTKIKYIGNNKWIQLDISKSCFSVFL